MLNTNSELIPEECAFILIAESLKDIASKEDE